MKILIVGLGSMGKRRARLTKGIDSSIRIAGVDTAESRRAEATDLGLIDAAYPSIAEAVAAEAPDAALVCTAPLTHAAIISELLDNSLPVFTELNLVADGYEENMAKAKEKGVKLGNKGIAKDKEKQIIAQYQQKEMSVRNIANQLNISTATIYNVLKRNNIQINRKNHL